MKGEKCSSQIGIGLELPMAEITPQIVPTDSLDQCGTYMTELCFLTYPEQVHLSVLFQSISG
jgi:hypothetical protein